MIQIYYEDGSSQVIKPSAQFEHTAQNIKDLVNSVAGKHRVKYYLVDFGKKSRNKN